MDVARLSTHTNWRETGPTELLVVTDKRRGNREKKTPHPWERYLSVQTQEEDHEEEEDKPEVGARQPGQSLGVSNERQTGTCTNREQHVD